MSNNTLACKKYYDKNKGNPEFRLRKAYQTRRQYYKKRYTNFWRMFQEWKNLIIKPIEKPVKKSARNKEVEAFRNKQHKNLMKRMIDRWKDYEPEQLNPLNISIKPIICTF